MPPVLWVLFVSPVGQGGEAELMNQYPIHVVTAWLGNSPKVAMHHYLQVTDAHFEKAADDANRVAQGVVTQSTETADSDGNDSQPICDKPLGKQQVAAFPRK